MVKDGGLDICETLLKDQKYADAVDIIGLHYPNDFQDFSASLSQEFYRNQRRLWTSCNKKPCCLPENLGTTSFQEAPPPSARGSFLEEA